MLRTSGYSDTLFSISSDDQQLRPFATFRSPVGFGAYLAIVLSFLITSVSVPLLRFPLVARWAVVAIGLAGLAVTFTRSAWIALAVAFVASYLIQGSAFRPGFRRTALVVGGAGIAALLVNQGLASALAERLLTVTSLDFGSNSDRVEVWTGTGRALLTEPLALVAGFGASDFVRILEPIAGIRVAELGHAHNTFLEVAFKYGLIGLVALLVILARAWRLVRRASRGVGDEALLACAALSALVAYVAASFFENLWTSFNLAATLFLLIGLGAGSHRRHPVSPRDPSVGKDRR